MFSKKILAYSHFFPDFGLRSASVEKYLHEAQGRYLSFSFIISFFSALIITMFLLGGNILLFPVLFPILFFFFLKMPESEEKQRINILEAEMPLVLRSFGMLLDMNVPFVRALKVAAKYGEAGEEFAKIVGEIEKGASVPKALAKFAENINSAVVKKSVIQLISAYEHGSHGKEVSQIADDLISLQRYRTRDFISKSSFFGLLFVIFAAVIPTFFLVFASTGKFALDIEITKEQFLLVFLILFPVINAVILFVSYTQMPPSVFRSAGKKSSALIFVFLACVLALVMFIEIGLIEKFCALVLVILISLFLFRKEYESEVRTEKIEDTLPNALLAVSGLPKSYTIEKIFERMSDAKDIIGEESGKTLRQLRAKITPENALIDLWKQSHSFMLRRMGELMLNAHTSGANISEKMHEMAEDLLKFSELKRERENALAMQKYTLILGAFIVPLILSASLSLITKISLSLWEKTNNEVLQIAPNTISAYIIIYAALSALYISHSEERNSSMVSYFAILSIVGLFISLFQFLGG